MDRHVLAILIPVITLFFTGLVVFSFTSLGRAIARRIEGGAGDTDDRLARLEADQERLYRALVDAHERLDVAERALAREAAPHDVAGVREPRRGGSLSP